MKSHSSRPERKAWDATELSSGLHNLVGRSSLIPLSYPPLPWLRSFLSLVLPSTSTMFLVSQVQRPKKRTVPFRSYKPDHLKFHWWAKKQISKGQILSSSQLTMTMVDGGKSQEVQRWPKVKNSPGPLLSGKKVSKLLRAVLSFKSTSISN